MPLFAWYFKCIYIGCGECSKRLSDTLAFQSCIWEWRKDCRVVLEITLAFASDLLLALLRSKKVFFRRGVRERAKESDDGEGELDDDRSD